MIVLPGVAVSIATWAATQSANTAAVVLGYNTGFGASFGQIEEVKESYAEHKAKALSNFSPEYIQEFC